MSDEQTLEFWKNMALGLKDELIQHRDGINSLLAERVQLAEALLLTVESLDPYVQTGKETCTIDELIAPIGIEAAYALAKGIIALHAASVQELK
jgi:hypothetical protein